MDKYLIANAQKKFQGLRFRFGLGDRRPLETWQRADQLKEALHKLSQETFAKPDEGRSYQTRADQLKEALHKS